MGNYTFENDGFVILRGLFTEAEVAAWKAEMQRLLETHDAHSGVFVGLAANSPVFRAAAAHPRLLDALEAAIGPDIEFLSDKVAFKSSDTTFGSPWHQDWMYWKGAHKVSVWIALDPATRENGCLKFLPGSHKSPVTHDGVADSGEGFVHRLRQEAVDESQAAVIECAPGDAVIFHDLTLHASYPNTTGRDRWALISTYRNAAEPDLDYSWSVAAFVARGKKTEARLTP